MNVRSISSIHISYREKDLIGCYHSKNIITIQKRHQEFLLRIQGAFSASPAVTTGTVSILIIIIIIIIIITITTTTINRTIKVFTTTVSLSTIIIYTSITLFTLYFT